MQINIRTHHVNITDSIKDYVEKKLSKLDKFFDHIQELSVDLEYSEVSDHNLRHVITVTAWVSGSVLRAKESASDMYASVDMVFDKLEKQLTKYKEKLKSRSRRSGKKTAPEFFEEAVQAQKPVTNPKKYYVPKPMFVEDAASHIEEEGTPFVFFRNAQTDDLNVLYREDDGGMNLLEP